MIIVLSNQKGGVGKTTTVNTLWSAFPKSLAIDMDPQGNLGIINGSNEEFSHDIYEVLTGKCKIQDAIQNLEKGDFVSSSAELSEVTSLSPQALKETLTPVKKKYQHIIIDTPPALNIVTLNALCAADMVIVPIQADIMSLRGLDQLTEIITAVKEDNNPNLRIGGLLLTRFASRTTLRQQMRELAEEYAEKIGTRVFKASIREMVAVPESQTVGQDIFSYAPKSSVTEDYSALVKELEEVFKDV